MTFLLKNDSFEIYINGNDAFTAVRHNIKLIHKALRGCTIKRWQIDTLSKDCYCVTIEYYNKQPSRIKLLKNLPPVICVKLPLIRVE